MLVRLKEIKKEGIEMKGTEKQIKFASDIINSMIDTFKVHGYDDGFDESGIDDIVDSIVKASESDIYAGEVIGQFAYRPLNDSNIVFDRIISSSMPDEHNEFAIEVMKNLIVKHPEMKEDFDWIA